MPVYPPSCGGWVEQEIRAYATNGQLNLLDQRAVNVVVPGLPLARDPRRLVARVGDQAQQVRARLDAELNGPGRVEMRDGKPLLLMRLDDR